MIIPVQGTFSNLQVAFHVELQYAIYIDKGDFHCSLLYRCKLVG